MEDWISTESVCNEMLFSTLNLKRFSNSNSYSLRFFMENFLTFNILEFQVEIQHLKCCHKESSDCGLHIVFLKTKKLIPKISRTACGLPAFTGKPASKVQNKYLRLAVKTTCNRM